MLEIYKNTLLLVDGDRTTLDTDKLQQELMRSIMNFGFNPHILEEKIASAKAVDEIYSPLTTLKTSSDFRRSNQKSLNVDDEERAGAEMLQRVIDAFVPEGSMKQRNLMPGAGEFLEELHRCGSDAGIFTRGDVIWQHLKLVAAGIDSMPIKYTDSPRKYEYINSCFTDGKFVINDFKEFEGNAYDKVIMIDDKFENLANLREQAIGIQVLLDDLAHEDPLDVELLDDQPLNLIRVIGMRGVRAYFKKAEELNSFNFAIQECR